MNWLMDSNLINDQIGYDPALEVHTAWDLGLDDATSVWFFQTAFDKVRFFDYMEVSGESLKHCLKRVKEKLDSLDAVAGTHYAPHDIKVREYSTGQTRISVAAELGFRFLPVRKLTIEDGIESVRALLQRSVFAETACERGVNALKSYRKDWDDKTKTYRNRPVHDWASHGADAMRTAAVGLADRGVYGQQKRSQLLNRTADDKYDILGY